jgi:long-chain acyl-CoA synthetase
MTLRLDAADTQATFFPASPTLEQGDIMARIVSRHAEAQPDREALIDETGSTTWSDLNARVNRLVHALRGLGLRTGDTFSVFCGNRREYFEVMLAAAHAGWRYAPVNWHFTPDELAYVVANSDSKALIADVRLQETAVEARQRDDFPALLGCVMVGSDTPPEGFTGYERMLAAASAAEPDEQTLGGPMFYTSGTTGRPKGVRSTMMSPGQPLEVLEMIGSGLGTMLRIPSEGTALLTGPVYHSAPWAFSFLPLLGGLGVAMRHKFDPAETLELIDRHRIVTLHLVPTQFRRLLQLDDAAKSRFDGSSLVSVWHGAAPCPPAVKQAMIDWWGKVIWEYYGATEGSIVSVCSSEEWLARPGTVGKPLPTVEIRIVREDGSRGGPGEEGQIYIKNLMGTDFEYHKEPEKTAAAHLEPGVFTFGDIGYMDADGYLYLSDRKIDMIISGGVNIYPAEIEGVLVTHPAVHDAAVFGIPNDEFGEEVKAAVELREGYSPSGSLADELIAHVREHLAGYKAPRSVDFESALPRYPTGKLYKRILRDRYWEGTGRRI